MIIHARETAARAVNTSLVMLYWNIGRGIHANILREQRAGYGERIVHTLAGKLEREFGRGFGSRNLFRMVRFAEVFPEPGIVSSLMTQLGWTHFLHLLQLEDPLQRDFYAELCRLERWNTRTLAHKISGKLYERTALSRKPDHLIRRELAALRRDGRMTPAMVFRDAYVLDFLGLQDTYAEHELEAAILREIETFILELGNGFCFVARQKHMPIDGRDYHLDLLCYHRPLRRLVAIDLKLRNFEAGDKGQMELYLNWLKKHEKRPDEEAPVGIILCAGRQAEHVELLELEQSGIHVASYLTKLLPKRQLQQKLQEIVSRARARLERRPRKAAPTDAAAMPPKPPVRRRRQ
jgi:predicted nuclease of restriction endonuclease-like (RecB) superfamily